MKLERLEKQLRRSGVEFSKLDDVFRETQDNFIPGPNESDTRCRRLLEEINDDLSDINESVCGIGEKIEQLKTFEGIL